MNTIFKTVLCLPVAAMFLTLALTGRADAAAEKQTPLIGSIQGQEKDVFQGPPPGTLAVDGTVTGIAPHLGRFTLLYKLTVTLLDGSATGSGQLIAANGDTILATVVGTSVPVEPGI